MSTKQQPNVTDQLDVTVTVDTYDCETPVSMIFQRDLGDTWSVHVGTSYLAVNNPAQGVVISRLVELLAAQNQSITFDTDGTERDHE